MLNEEQIIKKINQVWKELLKETTIERLAIKVIQIKQLYEVINRKELIIEPEEPLSYKMKEQLKEMIKKGTPELKKHKE